MKKTIEIEDSLEDRVNSAIEEVKDELETYIVDNESETLPDLGNDLDYSGAIHKIVDGSVPLMTKEINDTWYLHSAELEKAYKNAGVGTNPRENNGGAAIYFYIHEQIGKWYSEHAQDVFDTLKETLAQDDHASA